MDIFVLIKQVPDQGAKAGINADGTIDRAKARRMLNPFDRYALQAALHTRRTYGGRVTAITMGPPPAIEILYEAIAHGVDQAILLSDRRLAASDTLATAYALFKVVRYAGPFDLVFCGLQTTDGDTAQVGPQLAERLQVPQVTYCEDFEIEENTALLARRVIEGGAQSVRCPLPAVVTVANSYERLAYKTLRGAQRVQQLQRDEAERRRAIRTVTLDDIEADPARCGLKGSPTIVAATEKVGEIGGHCTFYQGKAAAQLVSDVLTAEIIAPDLVKR
ncbi:electron transfer flavoprotein subunit beta/FixA family protein [Gloeobacter kilaueensis]|uniref:Electron transfer flavoprotein small subunit n=1 Tax=Gloeobacter kilaueensis (strain ATCC BAA-2537 / CCAP 1431/1 / ULC 316 / JS1) TaxID=1183438 RepID=U5QDJ2_GLOK1|nr:electron transfer flavoprotein subunit beta/FixA family protein [Gloeobacter kilaueensis]AGY56961.1 electron transfer flavoprotein subunit beta [Gloeobacter kilaueensis JS1]